MVQGFFDGDLGFYKDATRTDLGFLQGFLWRPQPQRYWHPYSHTLLSNFSTKRYGNRKIKTVRFITMSKETVTIIREERAEKTGCLYFWQAELHENPSRNPRKILDRPSRILATIKKS